WKLRGMGISVAEELEGECLSLLLQVGVVPGSRLEVVELAVLSALDSLWLRGDRELNLFGATAPPPTSHHEQVESHGVLG
ncbi:unnamed protein product, partial [Linum tenue]